MLCASELLYEGLVLRVRPHPEPRDLILLKETFSAIVDVYSDRENRSGSVDPLEVQTRVVGVLGE